MKAVVTKLHILNSVILLIDLFFKYFIINLEKSNSVHLCCCRDDV